MLYPCNTLGDTGTVAPCMFLKACSWYGSNTYHWTCGKHQVARCPGQSSNGDSMSASVIVAYAMDIALRVDAPLSTSTLSRVPSTRTQPQGSTTGMRVSTSESDSPNRSTSAVASTPNHGGNTTVPPHMQPSSTSSRGQQSSPAPNVASTTAATPPGPSNNRGLLVAIIVCVVLLIIIVCCCGGYFFWYQRKDTVESPVVTSTQENHVYSQEATADITVDLDDTDGVRLVMSRDEDA
eukprot:m.574410 g.574410  ORF g.574410 m.574410 type:complete len:237 (-) comp22279_c0_seq68:2770-3480(-)